MEISLADVVGWLVRWCGLATVFALGLRADWSHVSYLLRRPALLLRSFLAMYVLTPVVAVLMVRAVDVERAVEIAVLLMAISSGAPALPKKLLQLGGNPRLIHSGGILMAALAILTVPVSLAVLGRFFHQNASVPAGEVARMITAAILAPQLAGMAVRRFWPGFARRISEPLISLAGLMLLVLMALILVVELPAILGMGLPAMLLIVAMAVASLAVGHALGGPVSANRTTLAIACATRFPALGVLIATLNFPDGNPLPLVVGYLLITHLTVLPYMSWRKAGTPRVRLVERPLAPPTEIDVREAPDLPESLSLRHRKPSSNS